MAIGENISPIMSFGRWLDHALSEHGITTYTLARAYAERLAREPPGSDARRTTYPRRPTARGGFLASPDSLPKREMAAYRSGKRVPGPKVAFRVGEAMRDLNVSGACGPLALLLARHNAEFLKLLHCLTATPDGAMLALRLFEYVPLVVADEGGLIAHIEQAKGPELSDAWHAAALELVNSMRADPSIEPARTLHTRAESRRPIPKRVRAKAQTAKPHLVELLADQGARKTIQEAFLNGAKPRRIAGSAWHTVDRLLVSTIANLAPHDWAEAYRQAARWHRLALRQVDPKRFYSSSGFPEIEAYLELLDLADTLDLSGALS